MKIKSRIRITSPIIQTRDEAEAVMNDIALIEANRRRKLTERDEKVLAVNKQYESVIAFYDESLKDKTEILHAWADRNAPQFKDRKSIRFLSGTLGYRTGNPKLALLSKWTWEKVLGALMMLGRSAYIRTVEEVDKEKIIADRASLDLATFGTKITQDESFYVEPDLTQFEHRQSVPSVQ